MDTSKINEQNSYLSNNKILMIYNLAFTYSNPEFNQIIPLNLTIPEFSSIYVGVQSVISVIGSITDNFNNIYKLTNTLIQNQVHYFDYTQTATVTNLIISGFKSSIAVEIIVYSGTNTVKSSLDMLVETSNITNEFTLKLPINYSTYGLVFSSSRPGSFPFVHLNGLDPIETNTESDPTYLVGTSLLAPGLIKISGVIGRSNISAVALSLKPLMLFGEFK